MGGYGSENKMMGHGAPGATRTHGTQIRNLVLYPPELRGHVVI
jgi:hypothetical protein